MHFARASAIVCLAFALMVAMVPPAAATSHDNRVEERLYYLGTGLQETFVRLGSDQHTVGSMNFELGTLEWELVKIRVNDGLRGDVTVSYAFYGPGHNDPSLTGGSGASLLSGYACGDFNVEPPEQARSLRIVLNNAEALDNNVCPGDGVATYGELQITLVAKKDC